MSYIDAKMMHPHPPNWRPEGKEHRDSWVRRPRHKTRTELMETYNKSRLPDTSCPSPLGASKRP